jgi:hypothetical protein
VSPAPQALLPLAAGAVDQLPGQSVIHSLPPVLHPGGTPAPHYSPLPYSPSPHPYSPSPHSSYGRPGPPHPASPAYEPRDLPVSATGPSNHVFRFGLVLTVCRPVW